MYEYNEYIYIYMTGALITSIKLSKLSIKFNIIISLTRCDGIMRALFSSIPLKYIDLTNYR